MRVVHERRFDPVVTFDPSPYLIDHVGLQLREIVTEIAKSIGVDLSGVVAK
jgi:hypothetical protein